MDNVLINNIDWTYPKAEGTPQIGTYFIGDPFDPTCVGWCLASYYLIYTPLGNSSRFYWTSRHPLVHKPTQAIQYQMTLCRAGSRPKTSVRAAD